MIYHLGYNMRVNVPTQVRAAPVMVKPFRWEDLGIDLYDMEGEADEGF
jgi:hypothetical protein